MQRIESLDELVKRVARQRMAQAAPQAESKTARDWTRVPFTAFCDLLGVPLTLPQRVLCKVAFEGLEPRDLPSDEYEIAQRLLKPADQAEPIDVVPKAARTVLTLVKGARIGGTYMSALYAAHRALVADLSTLAPGEMARVIFGAPDLDLAGQALSYAVGAFESHPELEGLVQGVATASRFVIERPNDGREVEFVTRAASRGGKTFRSRSLVCACLTEVAFFLTSDYIVNDEECFRAVKPRILPGGLCILESTAYAEAGLLFDEFERNWGSPTTSLAMHAPTLFMLPTERNREVVAIEEATNPDNALREFGGQFIPFGSSVFFPRELIKRARVSGNGKRGQPCPGEVAAVGGDLGLVSDAAAFVAVHRRAAPIPPGGSEQRDPKTDRYRVEETAERRPARGAPLKLKDLVPLAAELAGRHGQKSALFDQWNAHAAREHAPEGFAIEVETLAEEAEMYDAVLELMKQGQVEIPAEHEALLRQLPLVMSKPLAGGGKKIVLPKKFGSHCDLVPAFVKAVWRAKQMMIGSSVEQPKGGRRRTMAGGY